MLKCYGDGAVAGISAQDPISASLLGTAVQLPGNFLFAAVGIKAGSSELGFALPTKLGDCWDQHFVPGIKSSV